MAYSFVHALDNFLRIGAFPNVTSKLSVAAWVRVTSTPANGHIHTVFAKGVQSSGDHRNFSLDYRTQSSVTLVQIAWTTSVNNYTGYAKTVTLSTATWIHLCATVDWTTNPDSVELYIDGVAQAPGLNVGSNNTTPETGPITHGTNIGALYGPADGWGGDIAELTVWGAIVTGAEAAELARRYSAKIVHIPDQILYPPLIRELVDHRGQLLIDAFGPFVSSHAPIMNP